MSLLVVWGEQRQEHVSVPGGGYVFIQNIMTTHWNLVFRRNRWNMYFTFCQNIYEKTWKYEFSQIWILEYLESLDYLWSNNFHYKTFVSHRWNPYQIFEKVLTYAKDVRIF